MNPVYPVILSALLFFAGCAPVCRRGVKCFGPFSHIPMKVMHMKRFLMRTSARERGATDPMIHGTPDRALIPVSNKASPGRAVC